MPYALILIGAVALVAGIQNSYKSLWALIEGDFQAGFLSWVAALAVIGAMGYVPRLRPLSVALMTLLLVVLVLSNGGVFAKLQSFIQSSQAGAGSASTGLTGTGVSLPNITNTIQALSPEAQINLNLGNVGGQ